MPHTSPRRLGVALFAPLIALASPVRADEVIVVTGSRGERPLAETAVATEVIGRDAIEASGARDVADLLAHHPGLEVVPSFRGAAVRIQGMDPAYVLLLVDGRRAIGRVGGAIDLRRFATAGIERIEIIKGASAALYGSDALAGVINIITRRPERALEVELETRAGQRESYDASASVAIAGPRWSSRTGAELRTSAGYDLAPDDPATTGSALRQTGVEHVTRTRLADGIEVAARADYLRRDQAGIDQSASGAIFDRTTATETGAVGLAATWRPAPGRRAHAETRLALWRDQFLRDQRGADALDSYEVARQRLAELDVAYEHTLHPAHVATVGADSMAERLVSDRLASPGSRMRGALFAQYEWTVSRHPYVIVAPGARVDLDTQFGSAWSPRLTARWDPRPGVAVRASYGHGFRAPGFRELLLRFENPSAGYRVDGNPALEPETSRSSNVGVEARLGRAVWASVSGFHNAIDDLITTELQSDDGVSVYRYVNIAAARTRGFESRLRLELGSALHAELGYAFTDTLDRATGRPLPDRARHRASVAAGYRYAPWRLGLTARGSVSGARPMDAATDARAPAHAAIDARADVGATDHLTLFAGITNALDAGDPVALPIPPRSIHAGLSARY